MLQISECTEIWDVRIPSVSFAASVPTPFGPSGHFPLTGGIGPLSPRGALGCFHTSVMVEEWLLLLVREKRKKS